MQPAAFCPMCETESRIERVTETVLIDVRGEAIPVSVNFECCRACGERWETPGEDMMDRAFRTYRDLSPR